MRARIRGRDAPWRVSTSARSLRDRRLSRRIKPPQRLTGWSVATDPNPTRCPDRNRQPWRMKPQGRARRAQVHPVPRAIDAQGAAEIARPATERGVQQRLARAPISAHDLESRPRAQCPQQDRRAGAFAFRHDVQAKMHPVDEVDIGVSGFAKHRGIAQGAATEGVGCLIVGRICFGLDDRPFEAWRTWHGDHQPRANEVPRD